jgi:predicted aldo/keto reductase-like oxidoreductase
VPDRNPRMDRREFLRTTAAGIAASGALGTFGSVVRAAEDATKAASDARKLIRRNENPDFVYRRLGRTNFNCGRIVAGWIKEPSLLRKMIAGGVNYLDTARHYGEYEVELAPLLKNVRDRVWVTSKASGIAGYDTLDNDVQKLYREAMTKFLGEKVSIAVGDKREEITTAIAPREKFLAVHKECVRKMKATGQSPDWRPVGRRISDMYARMLDESLDRMKIETIDCYMMHGIEIPWIFQCTELWETFEKAQKAGKVKWFGYSTHANQKEVLAAGVEANERGPWQIALIMPAVNPGENSFHDYRPSLEGYKKQDVGIVAMKSSGTVRKAANKTEEKLAKIAEAEKLNPWERAKVYMLQATDSLIDAVIATVDKTEQVTRALSLPTIKLAAAERRDLEAVVRAEMAGACRLCGNCTAACPKDIAVADVLRCHAYVHQYNDRELAASLYASLGYNPGKRCLKCGRCRKACPSSIDLPRAIGEVVAAMA